VARADACRVEDLPDGGGADLNAEPGELAVEHPPVVLDLRRQDRPGLLVDLNTGRALVGDYGAEPALGRFDRVAEIDLTGDVVRGGHEAQEALDEVVDEAEGARLLAIAVDGDRLALQGLDDEIGDDAPVIGVHARPIGVEDAGDLDAQLVLAEIVEEQGLGAALAFVVAGARADRVDVAAIILGLGMDVRVAIDLAGRGLEDPRVQPLGQAQHVDGAVHAGLGGLHRIVLVVDRRSRAGEIVDLVDLDIERERHVMAHQLEARIAQAIDDVLLVAGEIVVDAQDVVAARQKALAEMRPQEARAAGDQYPLAHESLLIAAEDTRLVSPNSLAELVH